MKSTDKKSGLGRHGAHAAVNAYRQGKAINKRTRLGRYLKKKRQDFIEDLGGNLSPPQEIILDRILEQLMFLSIVGEHAKKQGTDIVKDGKIIPCLGENYIAYTNSISRCIRQLYELEERNRKVAREEDADGYLQAVMGGIKRKVQTT